MKFKAAVAGGGGWLAALALVIGGGVGDVSTDGDLDGPAGVFAPAPDDRWLDFCLSANAIVTIDETGEVEGGGIRYKAQRGEEELNWPSAGGNINADYYAHFKADPQPVELSDDARACLGTPRGG